jgi:hypothetical protein
MLTSVSLKEAAGLMEQIEGLMNQVGQLQTRYNQIIGGGGTTGGDIPTGVETGGRMIASAPIVGVATNGVTVESLSLRDHVFAVLQSGPKTKEEILQAVQARGYKFNTSNPLNSLGVVLYGQRPKLKRVEDGKFALRANAQRTGGTKRNMSPAARERIAAAQRARWAKQKTVTK